MMFWLYLYFAASLGFALGWAARASLHDRS